MNKTILYLFLLLTISCTTSTPPESGLDPNFVRGKFLDDWTYQVNPRETDVFTLAIFKLWVPASIEPKAILVLSPGYNSSALGLTGLQEWQDFARKEHLALLGVQFENGDYSASPSSSDAMLFALEAIARERGMTRLKELPFLLRGFSAGGLYSYYFSQYHKDKTIAFANIKGARSFQATSTSKSVPGLIIAGEKDEGRIAPMKTSFYSHRKNKSVWTFAIEPNSGHSVDNSDILTRQYFSGILKKRLINKVLIDIDENSFYLGDNQTLEYFPYINYPLIIDEASSLIDTEFAQYWFYFNK